MHDIKKRERGYFYFTWTDNYKRIINSWWITKVERRVVVMVPSSSSIDCVPRRGLKTSAIDIENSIKLLGITSFIRLRLWGRAHFQKCLKPKIRGYRKRWLWKWCRWIWYMRWAFRNCFYSNLTSSNSWNIPISLPATSTSGRQITVTRCMSFVGAVICWVW